jgi:two-component system, NarL family, nitrate/nitrite response regulator NarL
MSDEILVADDDPDSRRAIAEALSRAGHATAVAADGDEALAIAEHDRPALVIAEVLLPGVSGYELCRAVKDRYGSRIPVVLVSDRRTEPADRLAGLLIGADDYVVKPVLPAELVVRVGHLLVGAGAGELSGVEKLTPRERDVMVLLTEGLSQVQIAERLVITAGTVAKHIEHILGKLRVHTRAQAVALALRVDPMDPARSGAREPTTSN